MSPTMRMVWVFRRAISLSMAARLVVVRVSMGAWLITAMEAARSWLVGSLLVTTRVSEVVKKCWDASTPVRSRSGRTMGWLGKSGETCRLRLVLRAAIRSGLMPVSAWASSVLVGAPVEMVGVGCGVERQPATGSAATRRVAAAQARAWGRLGKCAGPFFTCV